MDLLISCPKVAGRVTLPNKLGSADSKSMGPPNCGWLPTRLDKCTIPDSHATSNTNINREATLITAEVAELLSKGAVVKTQLSLDNCVPDISGGEEG